MELRFYEDPDTGQPHIYGHGVTEQEVEEVLRGRGEDLQATGNSRRKIGQTSVGRYCKSSMCLPRILTAYSSLPHMNRRARPRKPSVVANGGNQNEQAEILPRLG